MSGRLLRRVLKEQEEKREFSSDLDRELTGVASSIEDEEEEENESSAVGAPSTNPFDLLDDQEDEDETSAQDLPVPVAVKHVSRKPADGNQVSNRKSKKKKKKSKEEPSSAKPKGEKSLDAILEDLSISSSPSSHQIVHNAKSKTEENIRLSILAVDPKFLKAENELRKIFGSKVVKSFENQQSSRQIYGGRRIGHIPRKTILVSPTSFWPRWDNSMSMELLETKNEVHYFRYVHSPSYSHAQEAFETAKAANDLDAIAMILHHHPYHVESLLTFAELFKYSGEHQSSADAIAKCLYAMECAWHPLFSPPQGNYQLKYSHDTNKPLFVALFSHMKNMDRRGCHRSALEVCKLLLSLDHDDPTGALFCIDYFALRAQEYGWLEQFVEEYRTDNSLWLFPNFSYSLAVARFYMERDAAPSMANTEKATSTDLMKQALMLHPLVLQKLVTKAPLKDSAWTQILKCSFFGHAKAGSPSLDHLINIYVERSYLIWRYPELQNLLKEAAFRVIESIRDNSSEAKDWGCVRKEAFSSEKNEYSHLIVSEFSDVIPSIPPEELRPFMVGPQVVHEMPDGDREAVAAGIHAPRELAGRNPAFIFLESLLPWAHYGHGGNGQHDDDNDGNDDAQNIDQ